MKTNKNILVLAIVAILVVACGVFAACNPDGTFPSEPVKADVVRAFNSVKAGENVVTQTAIYADDNYFVTVITEDSANEYVLNKDFGVVETRDILGKESATAAAEQSALERAFEEALRLAGVDKANVVGFDFDRDTYMGKPAYKVEIEEVGAKYKYVFDVTDLTVLDSEIEFEVDLPTGSYISEAAAKETALKAAGVTEDVSASIVVRGVFEDGGKQYKVSFDHASYRYDISVDAVSGMIVKFSKSALSVAAPTVPSAISVEDAKQVALAFVFPEGAQEGAYTFRKAKLDYEDGAFIYEVELIADRTEYEFEISASGVILDVEIDGDRAEEQLPQDKRFITREEAVDAVRKHIADNGAYLIEAEIEKEGVGADKRYYYEIEVLSKGAKREFYVDALTGEVTEKGKPSDETPSGLITKEQAIANVLAVAGEGATVKEAELEYERGRYFYEVEVIVGGREYDYYVDAVTGTAERNEDFVDASGAMDERSALEIALGAFDLQENAIQVRKIKLESDDGRLVYDIEFFVGNLKYEIEIDAVSGAVIEKDVSYD